jgi:thiamine pyrophosphate-dependent acetolactate synthase large subunit-like protein
MKMRGADVLARALAAAGTRHVFTLSGNHVMPVFDAALDAKLSLIHVRHEAAAVHMADAWGRLTGEPGIALVTGGPGHANAVSALYTALAAESPLILISGHAPLDELGKGAFQEMRQAEFAAPLAKASWTAQSAQGLADDIARAWREACAGRPGPVHLSVPNDVVDAVVAAPALEFRMEEESIGPAPEILQALRAAKRPLILAGPARMRDGARSLEERTGIPVIGMESPRGVNDPSLGRLAEVLKQADVVLLLGKRADFTLKFGKAFAESCRVLSAEQFFAKERLCAGGWHDEVRAALSYRPPAWQQIDSTNHPVAVCREVQRLLDQPDSILVCDGGEFGQWAQACLGAPRRVINGPAGSIGAALPFAAAAQLAFPQARVVAMLGDGTFGFHMSEIDTAVRYGLNYLAVIGNDAAWNAEYQIQLRAYGAARAHGCELLPTRYGAVAAAMGAYGEDVASFDDLKDALARAAAASAGGKPACVNVMIERVAAPKY